MEHCRRRSDTMDSQLTLKGDTWPQYLAAIIVNILSFVYGLAIGWTAPMQPLLQRNETANTTFWDTQVQGLSNEDMSWIGCTLCIGGIVGTPFFGYCADLIGRKKTLILSGVPFLATYFIIIFAPSKMYLYIARILAGFAGSGSLAIIPMYIGEISDDSIRGILNSMLNLFICLGILVAYIVGSYTSYLFISLFTLAFTVIYLILAMWLPESPVYALVNENPDEAYRALTKLRGNYHELVQTNVNKISTSVNEMRKNNTQNMSFIQMCRDLPTRKALIISFGSLTVIQACGISPILNYTVAIFEAAGSKLSPTVATVIVGLLQVVGALLGTIFMERAGRKLLLMISSIGMAMTLFPIAIYFYLARGKANEELVTSIGWLPVTALAIYAVAFTLGYGGVPFVLVSELFKTEAKSAATSICITYLWILSFFMLKFFNNISDAFGIEKCFAFFALCCTGGAIFTQFYVFETKGKSHETILQELGAFPDSRASPVPFLDVYNSDIQLYEKKENDRYKI